MKKLSNLKGAKALNRKEQQSINGGGLQCRPACPPECKCVGAGVCVGDDPGGLCISAL